jgi:hypothetical protein
MPDFALDLAALRKIAGLSATSNFLGDTDTQTETNKTYDVAGTGNHLTSASAAVGDILTIPSGTDFKRLARGTAYQNVRTNAAGTNVEWGDPFALPSGGRIVGKRIPFGAGGNNVFGTDLLNTVTLGNGTGNTHQQSIDTTDGVRFLCTTGTNNTKVRAGWWGTANVMRKFNPTFTVRFRLNQAQASSQGILYIGFINVTAQPAAGTSMLNTLLDTKIGVLFGFRSSDTTFMIMSNNAQTLATYTAAGTPNSSATDTIVHTLSISLNDSIPNINWSFDGVAMTSITDTTNNVPPTGTALTPIIMIEAQTATSLSIYEHWSQLSEDWM